jgi:signal transduction histidine kinase
VRQAKDLNAMVGSVFQVSCIESKVFKAEPHQTNFWEFLYDLRSSYDSPPPNDVTLLWDFSPDLPTVDVDRGKLKQILQKLIDNAIVFTERGRVTVSARYLASEKRMEMKVADTGGGISSDSRRVIFENFRQGKTSETHGDRGVCLGLYIVKKLVELLNGSVVVDSSVGEGLTFTLQIPCEEVSVPSSSPMLPFTIQAEVHV